MSKEYLEAFERMTEHLDLEDEYSYKQLFEDEKIIKQALQRLESIDNAKPSETMKCLDRMLGYASLDEHDFEEASDDYNAIKQVLLKAQEQEKVLEVIKRVYTDLCFILSFDTFEEYNRSCDLVSVMANLKRVNKEEFDLLKRWLGK